MSYEYNTYVLTSDGYKSLHNLTNKDYVYDINSRLGRVTYHCTYPIQDEHQFSLVNTSVDTLPFILKNNVNVETVGRTLVKQTAPFHNVLEDDWLFHPWIKREQLHIRTSIDLSKTSTNFHDINHLYLFNNRILKIAEDLDIPQKAVKEILIREAAEYEEYIPLVYEYIKDNFDIDCTPPEDSIESFKTFKHFVKDNFVFKMNRYMDINLDFISFVISTLTRCKINKTSPSSQSFVYELSYRFENETDGILIDKLIEFAKTLDVKYEIKTTNHLTFINLFNKPLFDYVCNSLLVDLSCVIGSSDDCQKFFINNLYLNTKKVNGCKTIVLQIKELFLYHRKVVGISEAIEGFNATLLEDDFEAIDGSTLIVTEEGYYSRVMVKQPLQSGSHMYSYFDSQDRTTVLMTYTKK